MTSWLLRSSHLESVGCIISHILCAICNVISAGQTMWEGGSFFHSPVGWEDVISQAAVKVRTGSHPDSKLWHHYHHEVQPPIPLRQRCQWTLQWPILPQGTSNQQHTACIQGRCTACVHTCKVFERLNIAAAGKFASEAKGLFTLTP